MGPPRPRCPRSWTRSSTSPRPAPPCAATARSKVLIKLNVADGDLGRVLAVLPSMKAPTVNELADSGFHAVETVVDKAGVNRLIPTLKAAGAFDILELPISKIVA